MSTPRNDPRSIGFLTWIPNTTNTIIPTPSTNTHPNWKVDPCLKHFARVSRECIYIGRSIACDKQDIGFKWRHRDKQRVTFEKMGDGLLLDALCADGYTYSLYFRNQAVPKSWTENGLSQLHVRVVSLIGQLPDDTINYV